MNIAKFLETTAINILKTKPLDKFSVTEVINEVGTCKGTFYKNYKDKHDLVCSAFKNIIYKDIAETSDNYDQLVQNLLVEFKARHKVVYNAFTSVDINSVRYMNESILIDRLLKDRANNNLTVNDSVKFSATIYARTTTYIIVEWLRNNCEGSMEQIENAIKLVFPIALAKESPDDLSVDIANKSVDANSYANKRTEELKLPN